MSQEARMLADAINKASYPMLLKLMSEALCRMSKQQLEDLGFFRVTSVDEQRKATKSVIKKLLNDATDSPAEVKYLLSLIPADGSTDQQQQPPPQQQLVKKAKLRRCASCIDFDIGDVVHRPTGPHKCYSKGPWSNALTDISGGKDIFLQDADVKEAKGRLSLISEFLDHLKKKAKDHDDGVFAVLSCTGRQKRLVAYLKIFRHIYGKGVHGERKELPACTLIRVRAWFPDDEDDANILIKIGAEVAAYDVVQNDDDDDE